MTDAIHHTGSVGLVRGCDAFQDCGFKGGRLIKLLPFEEAQCFADDIAFVGITTGVDEDPEKQSMKGLLSVQVHTGPPMKIEFRDIRLKRLVDTATVPPMK